MIFRLINWLSTHFYAKVIKKTEIKLLANKNESYSYGFYLTVNKHAGKITNHHLMSL